MFLFGAAFTILLLISFSIFSCKSDTANPVNNNPTFDANTINGTITFVDTLFISDTNHGYYDISAFSTWPPQGNASASSKIIPVKSNGKYSATFKLLMPGDGSFTLTTAFIKTPYVQGSSVLGLGMYDAAGNDTTHSQSIIYGSHPKAVITGGAGIGNINFNSWIDTAMKIYNF
jgi:hypothetical protein